jgi:hypothetical protein
MTSLEKAQSGLRQIEEAISEVLATHPSGLTNGDITAALALESDQEGKQRDYLAWSVLGRMMKAGKVTRSSSGKPVRVLYRLVE